MSTRAFEPIPGSTDEIARDVVDAALRVHSTDSLISGQALKENGCAFQRHGRGDHDVWTSPKAAKPFTVPVGLPLLVAGFLLQLVSVWVSR